MNSRRFYVTLIAAMTAFFLVVLSAAAIADQVVNKIDNSTDPDLEFLSVLVGGQASTEYYIDAQSGDGDAACNIDVGEWLKVAVVSTNPAVQVDPSTQFLTFTACGKVNGQTVKLNGIAPGASAIRLLIVENATGGGAFYTNPADFFAVVDDSYPTVASTNPADGATEVPVGSDIVFNFSEPVSIEPGAFTLQCPVGTDTTFSQGTTPTQATLDPSEDLPAGTTCRARLVKDKVRDADALADAVQPYPLNFTTAVPPSDTTPPVITPNVSGTLGNNDWYVGDVTVSWAVEDLESEVTATSGCDQTVINSDTAGTTLTCGATSAGGTSSESVTIKRDVTAPTASANALPAPNANDWNNTDVTVTFSGSDDPSGIDYCSADVVLTSDGAGQSASGTCADKAGNTSNLATASGINIDETAPTLAPSVSPNPVVLNDPATASANANDVLSGVASSSCDPVDTSSVGSKSGMCYAEDKAGNTATASASYRVIYDWTGFFQPVENPNAWNKAKAGSSIPVKFELGGNQGLDVLTAGYPKATVVACPSASVTVDTIEEYATATANNGLVYDAVAHQYVYVWKTDKAWANKCFKFDLGLKDGTSRVSYVQFFK